MDNQLPSPNTPAPTELPAGVNPENLMPGVPGAEIAPTPAPGAPAESAPPAAPAPVLTAADVAAALAVPAAAGAPVTTPTPMVAGDVDVIEPEWVEKAEQVVRAHAGDPYGEEEAVESLQQDYLQKRYGINVNDPDADETKPKGA